MYVLKGNILWAPWSCVTAPNRAPQHPLLPVSLARPSFLCEQVEVSDVLAEPVSPRSMDRVWEGVQCCGLPGGQAVDIQVSVFAAGRAPRPPLGHRIGPAGLSAHLVRLC